jgi:FtsP/CotA-like multicopper oxidase with cupredoxin domain
MFKVIAVDGTDIEHEESESIIIQSGERYDFDLNHYVD